MQVYNRERDKCVLVAGKQQQVNRYRISFIIYVRNSYFEKLECGVRQVVSPHMYRMSCYVRGKWNKSNWMSMVG